MEITIICLQPLEVKLANQESDMVTLLKRLPLGGLELNVIRAKAEQMRGGQPKSRGEALLPLMLASFLFDALVITGMYIKQLNLPVFMHMIIYLFLYIHIMLSVMIFMLLVILNILSQLCDFC